MSVQHIPSKKAAATGSKPKKSYDIVQQGVKELYPLGDSSVVPNIDIVFVPGLGANPEESWKSTKTGFNWATDKKDGITKDFPKARVFLFFYESAWTGSLKVKQFIGNIASTLLLGLKNKRQKCPQRPIIFIGHSMGGLVIAKAINLSDSRRDVFPNMFESFAGCVFFGTPFNGAPIAAVASMLSEILDKFDQATKSKLLDLMKPNDESLSDLRNDFMRLVGKLSQRIELYCFWEQRPTDYAKMVGLPALSSITKVLAPKSLEDFVSRESATLTGIDNMGLAADHRDLVKFDDFKDMRYQYVREPLKKIIHGAHLVVKNRFNSTRDIDRSMVNSIMEVLDGAQVSKKRKALAQNFAPSSWIPKEKEFVDWLAMDNTPEDASEKVWGDCLYIQGPEGRGKTSTTLTALERIDEIIRTDEAKNTGDLPILLAYFFCDSAADYSSAEDLLKSLIRQLINQQETLAVYAKHFAKRKGDDTGKTAPKLTLENLWQTLQDMLTDEFLGRRVYFVVNNLHALPEDSESTIKLLEYVHSELEVMEDKAQKRAEVRWLFTSREAHNVKEAMRTEGVRVIDLEDERYGDQVQLELRKHAHKKIATLGSEKSYNKALTYFASSLIGKRASNTQWIDITCVQLDELPKAESDLKVRRVLESIPQDLNDLLKRAWLQIFSANPEDVEKIREMLRALVLTFEDPSEPELGVLAGLCSTEEEKAELRGLVEKCRPLLTIERTGKLASKIRFMNAVVKTHLLQEDTAKSLLGLSTEEIKWQHGVLALRSFTHIMDIYDYPEPVVEPDTVAAETDNTARGEEGAAATDANETQPNDVTEPNGNEEETATKSVDDNKAASVVDEDDENNDEGGTEESGSDDEDDDETESGSGDDNDGATAISWTEDDSEWSEEDADASADPESDETTGKALPYTIKHWLHHASKATLEIAEDLSCEQEFWETKSIIRSRWLDDFNRLTETFKDFDIDSLTGLHIAASVGFRHLVSALLRNGHADELNLRDTLTNAPLHFAAYFGRPNIVEELLGRGAVIDDGVEVRAQTPLSMAAFAGNVKIMRKLILRGADPKTVADSVGPVLNAAIFSGNFEAVELLVREDVPLGAAGGEGEGESPLALAALLSDPSMFEYLIDAYAEKIPPQEFEKALVKAAEAGRVEVFEKLLTYKHSRKCYQEALEQATKESNWEICSILLKKCENLDCNNLFFAAATCVEDQDKVLEDVWAHAAGSLSKETLNNSLYGATDTEKFSTVMLMLDTFGVNADGTGERYGTALTAAAYDGTIDIVRLLLDHGANVNSADGWALQTAAAEGHMIVVKELLSRGANVNACTSNVNFPQGTALQAACEAGKTEVVELLLEHKADANLKAGEYCYPILAAANKGEQKIVELLVKAKADLNVIAGDVSTVLINAAAYLPQETLVLLLDAGADIDLADKDGDTALMVAAYRGDKDCVQFLLDRGADLMLASKQNVNAVQAAVLGGDKECMEILVNRISEIMAALSSSIAAGNTALASTIRNAPKSEHRIRPGEGLDGNNKVAEEGGKEDEAQIDDEEVEGKGEEDQTEKKEGGQELQNKEEKAEDAATNTTTDTDDDDDDGDDDAGDNEDEEKAGKKKADDEDTESVDSDDKQSEEADEEDEEVEK